jgi:hypothetical protein
MGAADRNQAAIRRRRTLGFAYLVLAVFCGVVAAVPWPNKGPFDFAMWLSFAAVLLVIGGWQIDKASKQDAAAAGPGGTRQ